MADSGFVYILVLDGEWDVSDKMLAVYTDEATARAQAIAGSRKQFQVIRLYRARLDDDSLPEEVEQFAWHDKNVVE